MVAARAPGTTIEVRDLFSNVPARRKFLKAAPTEAAHVGEAVLHAALARPDVTFVFSRDGRVAREWLRAATRRERALAALGEPRLVECKGERGPVHIEAHLGPPERARAGAGGLHLLVNGRPVRDRPLARAVAQAYGSVLEHGRHPIGVVYVDLPSALVDVNVHPQKTEVRFEDARALFDAVTRELFDALAKVFAIPALGPMSRPWLPPPSKSYALPPSSASDLHRSTSPSATRRARFVGHRHRGDGSAAERAPKSPRSSRRAASTQSFASSRKCAPRSSCAKATMRSTSSINTRPTSDATSTSFVARSKRARSPFRSSSFPRSSRSPRKRPRRSPSTKTSRCDSASRSARQVPRRVAVHGVPALLARARPERLLRDLLAELGRVAGRPFSGAVDLVLATMACHGSVRAGDSITAEKAQALVAALDGVDFSGHCPHGRPVLLRIPFSELERRVGR